MGIHQNPYLRVKCEGSQVASAPIGLGQSASPATRASTAKHLCSHEVITLSSNFSEEYKKAIGFSINQYWTRITHHT